MFQALVEVPFGTVLLEEVAFRGVLFSMLARRYGVVWAVVRADLRPVARAALDRYARAERGPGKVAGQGLRGNIIAVGLSVLTTAVAGVLFTASGCCLAACWRPMGLALGDERDGLLLLVAAHPGPRSAP